MMKSAIHPRPQKFDFFLHKNLSIRYLYNARMFDSTTDKTSSNRIMMLPMFIIQTKPTNKRVTNLSVSARISVTVSCSPA